jgi:Alpha/beta hydrolase domain
VPPPPAQYFHGGVDGSNAFVPMLDADGNWEGGVRLPHVSSTVLGRRAAAPLGTYEPLNDAGLNPFNPFTLISGTFNRFSDAEILARYRTRQTYVRRIVLAAVSLAERHYITADDAAALVVAAQNEPLSDALHARERSSSDESDLMRRLRRGWIALRLAKAISE